MVRRGSEHGCTQGCVLAGALQGRVCSKASQARQLCLCFVMQLVLASIEALHSCDCIAESGACSGSEQGTRPCIWCKQHVTANQEQHGQAVYALIDRCAVHTGANRKSPPRTITDASTGPSCDPCSTLCMRARIQQVHPCLQITQHPQHVD